MDGDDRMARPDGCAESGREPGDAAFDLETCIFQKSGHQLRRLELLHSQLRKVENAVVQRRNRLGVAVDVVEAGCLLLVGIGGRAGHVGLFEVAARADDASIWGPHRHRLRSRLRQGPIASEAVTPGFAIRRRPDMSWSRLRTSGPSPGMAAAVADD